jgi:predicted amidohydrolase
VKVAAIQYKPQKGQREASWGVLSRLIQTAGEAGARLIVCPEMALTGYLFQNAAAVFRVAEAKDGPGLAQLSALAERYHAYIVCGYAEIETQPGASSPRLYNSARVVAPDGQLLCNYRKRLLYESDTTWALPGDLPYPLLRLPMAWLSVGICMDLNDDRFTRFLRQKRPHLLAFCTNWLDEGEEVLPYWRYRLDGAPCSFIAANTYGHEEAPGHELTRFCGGSVILSADGQELARAPRTGDTVILADIPVGESPSGISNR